MGEGAEISPSLEAIDGGDFDAVITQSRLPYTSLQRLDLISVGSYDTYPPIKIDTRE